MAHPAAGIGDIAGPAGDDVNVSMFDRLPCWHTAVDAHVETADTVPCDELAAYVSNEREHFRPFARLEIFQAHEVASRYDKDVSL